MAECWEGNEECAIAGVRNGNTFTILSRVSCDAHELLRTHFNDSFGLHKGFTRNLVGYDALLHLLKSPSMLTWLQEWSLIFQIIDVVLNPIYGLLDSVRVQGKFCEAISLLRDAIKEEGVLDTNKTIHPLLMAIRRHSLSLDVQRAGAEALWRVLAQDVLEGATSRFLVSAMGGLGLISSAMEKYDVAGQEASTAEIKEEEEVKHMDDAEVAAQCEKLQAAGVSIMCIFSDTSSFHDSLMSCSVVARVRFLKHALVSPALLQLIGSLY